MKGFVKRIIAITGMGTINPLGNTLAETWDGVVSGRSGIGPITLFDASTFPVRIAGEVKNFTPDSTTLPSAMQPLAGRGPLLCLEAVRMALDNAGLDLQRLDLSRIGVSLGGDEEYLHFGMLESVYTRDYLYRAFSEGLGAFITMLKHSSAQGQTWSFRKRSDIGTKLVALVYGIGGPLETSHTACSSSGHAIGKAMRLIENGDCDIVFAGGHCAMVSEFSVAGFHLLGTLSVSNDCPARASRPFDLYRDGFVMSEGSGILILEELEHAKKRGADIYALLTGYGSSSNAYRLTDTPPDGQGGDLSMQRALADANLTPASIGYINAHGTATQLNDASETLSIKNVFGERVRHIPVSSSKSMLGHLVTASSAVELIITVMAVQQGILPPTINLENPDPKCDLDYVPNEARSQTVTAALSNSFAFGGQNATLAVEKFTG
jgi:3-oxoacyl-[acyl-carrier-protein] synthase II